MANLSVFMSRVFAASLMTAAVGATACAGMATVTADEATAANGTRRYEGYETPQVQEATRVALQSMGYEIVSDPATLPIKTAPKMVQVNASGGDGHASAASAELAWTIEVDDEEGTPVVKALPRGYFAGQAQERFNAQWIVSAFDTLFSEIESNLPKPDPA